ncbi:spore-associated protein A [Streptomyces sp. Tu 6176]|uniref:spore-associated protein A n=1 Tax=Streptomyces sp. Tu 6176 TaxID=1470557 RepID=UPI001319D688|nr:spore-associated protein A [Streptomyces sp. Tu 6176]
MKKWPALAMASAAALTSLVVFSGTASATGSANVAYNGACGSGYKVVNWKDLQYRLGTVYLTYNGSTGYNCAVTIQTEQKYAGPMMVEIRRTGSSSWVRDSGDYRVYAGPVYTSATGSCVDWYGTYAGGYAGGDGTNCG